MATQAECGTNGTKGWQLTPAGQLQVGGDTGATLCLLGSQNYGPANGAITCPPATTRSGLTQCGNALFNCSEAAGVWTFNSNSTLSWARFNSKPLCLAARPGHIAKDRTADGPGGSGPVTATTIIGQCPSAGKPIPAANVFKLDSSGLLRTSTGCISSSPAPGVQLWAKPLSAGRTAILAMNPLSIAQQIAIPLADIPWSVRRKCPRTRTDNGCHLPMRFVYVGI